MEKSSPDFRSSLSRARGLGSAHHGVQHWWLQRITALAMLPLVLWFMLSLSEVISPTMAGLVQWVASPFTMTALILLIAVIFIHAKLGLQVVIEDYVHSPLYKYTLLIGVTFLCYGAAVLGVLSVLKLHFLFD